MCFFKSHFIGTVSVRNNNAFEMLFKFRLYINKHGHLCIYFPQKCTYQNIFYKNVFGICDKMIINRRCDMPIPNFSFDCPHISAPTEGYRK